MTPNPHRVPHATNFLTVAATSSNPRIEGVRQLTASIAAKRVVHTSLIDAQWDLQSDTRAAHQSGDHQIHARAPHTTLIDTEWDLEDPVVAAELKPAGVFARPPHTSLIDTEWDSQLEARALDQPEPPQVFVLPQQITLLDMVDMEEEPDPVITYFELNGPECLFESEFDPAYPHKDDLVFAALAR
jgi:hypothetical protein